MNQEEYDEIFETKDNDSEQLKAAFHQVSGIRKFEIELYWKRATYFWALIVVAFAGFFSILASETMPNKFFLALIVSCVGFVFTFAWFLSSRGSKYWQENWENHLDLLEDKVTGPLYKTLLQRPGHTNNIEKFLTGPLSISVSKVNQWVCVFVLFIWFVLVAFSMYKSVNCIVWCSGDQIPIVIHIVVIVASIAFCWMMFGYGKTHTEKHVAKVVSRETEIESP